MTTLTLYDRVRFVCLSFGSQRGRTYEILITDRLVAEFHLGGVASVSVADGAGERGEIWHQIASSAPAHGGTWWTRLLVPEGVAI